MFTSETTLDSLAGRARAGDARSQTALRHRLECDLVPIVRRTLRVRATDSPLDGQIRQIAAGLRRYAPDPERLDGECLVQRVVSRLCDVLLARLASPSRAALKETVRM